MLLDLFKAVYFIGAPYCSIVTFALLSIERYCGKILPAASSAAEFWIVNSEKAHEDTVGGISSRMDLDEI